MILGLQHLETTGMTLVLCMTLFVNPHAQCLRKNTKTIKNPTPGAHTHTHAHTCSTAVYQDFSCRYYSLSPSKNGDKAEANSTCIYL